MITTVIILLGLIVIGSIISGIIECDNSDLAGFHTIAIIIVIMFVVTSVILVNENEETIHSKTLVKPSMKIEINQNDSNIIKSDTTYIYEFKNNN